MKTLSKLTAFLLFIIVNTSSCKREDPQISTSGIPKDILSKIKELGYSTNNVKLFKDGYIVEGDIFISLETLNAQISFTSLRIAGTEQYRTTNLVTPPYAAKRTISISISGLSPYYTAALDTAILRYNNLSLAISFQRVASGGEINVSGYYDVGGYLGYAGSPSGGNPYHSIMMNTSYYTSTDILYIASVMQHEIGHCIGLRHTDYMDKDYSCPFSGNETGDPSGEIHIPGTPTSPDAGSFMLACVPYGSFSFNANDIIALRHLYPAPTYNEAYMSLDGPGQVDSDVTVPSRFDIILSGPLVGKTITNTNWIIPTIYDMPSWQPTYLEVWPSGSGGGGYLIANFLLDGIPASTKKFVKVRKVN